MDSFIRFHLNARTWKQAWCSSRHWSVSLLGHSVLIEDMKWKWSHAINNKIIFALWMCSFVCNWVHVLWYDAIWKNTTNKNKLNMSAVHVPVSYYIVCTEITHVLHCHIYVYKKMQKLRYTSVQLQFDDEEHTWWSHSRQIESNPTSWRAWRHFDP